MYMGLSYDLDELLAFAQRGDSASEIVEALGLRITERRVQQIIAKHLGPRPSKASVRKTDILRERVEAHMIARGLDPRRCSSCGRLQLRGGAIHAVNADLSLESLVFVCIRCAVPGDV